MKPKLDHVFVFPLLYITVILHFSEPLHEWTAMYFIIRHQYQDQDQHHHNHHHHHFLTDVV